MSRWSAAARRRATLPVVLLLIVLGVAACAVGPSTDIPSSIESRTELARLVALAQAGDFDALCLQHGEPYSNCRFLLNGNEDRVPPLPPTVVAERTNGAGESTSAGRTLTLCGRHIDGSPYRSEMLFFYDDQHRLTVIGQVWWTNFSIIDTVGGAEASATTGDPNVELACRDAP
jgi:hypothetical protein